ncbi:MAG: type IV pilin protein [Bacteriovoracaceae bacterium]
MEKRYTLNIKQAGMTMTELMVVISIAGVLATIAGPTYQSYRFKAKLSEAKLQLTNIYTAESAFFAVYGMYASCLNYMGYDPSNEKANRYFATGFFSGISMRDSQAESTAISSDLNVNDCPGNSNVVSGGTYFLAGKGAGTKIVNTLELANANWAGTAGDCSSPNPAQGNCVGTQANANTNSFVAAAVGYIFDLETTGLTINNMKLFRTGIGSSGLGGTGFY